MLKNFKIIFTRFEFNLTNLSIKLKLDFLKMYNMNNNNGNNSQNIWDQMALFNQLTLRNILNSSFDLGTPELRAAVASMSEEQKDDALVFLECNTE